MGDGRATEGQSTPRERKHIDIRQLLQVHYEEAAPDVAEGGVKFITGKGASISDNTINYNDKKELFKRHRG